MNDTKYEKVDVLMAGIVHTIDDIEATVGEMLVHEDVTLEQLRRVIERMMSLVRHQTKTMTTIHEMLVLSRKRIDGLEAEIDKMQDYEAEVMQLRERLAEAVDGD